MRLLIIATIAAVLLPAGQAVAGSSTFRSAPASIAFGTKQVGSDYFDGVRITNRSGRTLRVIVEGGLPDDFGFGFMPGSTCPVLSEGGLMENGASCRAVVRYSPSEFFVGRQQTGSLTVTGTDPDSGALVGSREIPVTGTGKL